jgi:hypothetical protein
MRRNTAISALLGALLLVGSPAVWYLSQPPTSAGDLEVFDASPTTAVDEPAPAVSPDEPAQTFTVSEPRGPLVAIAPPARITIPAIGVDAPVVPVALEDDGSMEIPDDIRTVGWFEPGVRPGEDGSAVISGHVDSRVQGRGAFFELEDGSTSVTRSWWSAGTGERLVRGRPHDAALRQGRSSPSTELFTREGPPRLVLITCGGAFDARAATRNVVIVAVPDGERRGGPASGRSSPDRTEERRDRACREATERRHRVSIATTVVRDSTPWPSRASSCRAPRSPSRRGPSTPSRANVAGTPRGAPCRSTPSPAGPPSGGRVSGGTPLTRSRAQKLWITNSIDWT